MAAKETKPYDERTSRTVLYLLVGYPGSGKTTVANYIREATGAIHIWADQERRHMFSSPTHSQAESRRLYRYLNEKADHLLQAGKSVIFDTNFNFYKDRQHLRDIAAEHGAETKLIWLTTSKELAGHRATSDSHQKPTRLFGNMSSETFERIAGHLEPPTDEEQPIKLDGTDLSRETALEAIGL